METRYETWRLMVQEYIPLIVKTVATTAQGVEQVDVGDMVSDVVIRCLERCYQLQNDPSKVIHRSYIEKVSVTVATNHMKRHFKRRQLSKTDKFIEGLDSLDAGERQKHYEDDIACKQVLQALSEGEWSEIFNLLHEERLSKKEIAIRTGLSYDTVKRAIRQMKAFVREELKDDI